MNAATSSFRRPICQRATALFVVLVAVTVLWRPVVAQTPVPLIHGFNENGTIWPDVTAGLVGFDITTHTPTLNSHNAFSSQAAEAVNELPAGALINPILIGHSNGGLVSRELAKSRSLRGLFTFGTPNGGGPIVVSYPSYVNFASNWVASGIWALTSLDESLWWEMDWSWQIVVWYAVVFAANNVVIPAIVTELLDDMFPSPVIAEQADPGGVHINYLNSSGNLAVEASNVQQRVGIVVSTDNAFTGGPLRIALDGWSPGSINALAWGLEALALTGYILASDLYWDTVNNYWEYDPFYYARLNMGGSWQDFFWYFLEYDTYWCWAIHNAYTCGPSDGFFPLANQTYPGAVYSLVNAGRAHTAEQHDPPVVFEIRQQVAAILGPPDPPPPSPLSVSISGPQDVQPLDNMCNWLAVPSGGVQPYNYTWSGVRSGSTQLVWGAPSDSGWLYVQVTDANGTQAYAETYVSAYWEANPCAA